MVTIREELIWPNLRPPCLTRACTAASRSVKHDVSCEWAPHMDQSPAWTAWSYRHEDAQAAKPGIQKMRGREVRQLAISSCWLHLSGCVWPQPSAVAFHRNSPGDSESQNPRMASRLERPKKRQQSSGKVYQPSVGVKTSYPDGCSGSVVRYSSVQGKQKSLSANQPGFSPKKSAGRAPQQV